VLETADAQQLLPLQLKKKSLHFPDFQSLLFYETNQITILLHCWLPGLTSVLCQSGITDRLMPTIFLEECYLIILLSHTKKMVFIDKDRQLNVVTSKNQLLVLKIPEKQYT